MNGVWSCEAHWWTGPISLSSDKLYHSDLLDKSFLSWTWSSLTYHCHRDAPHHKHRSASSGRASPVDRCISALVTGCYIERMNIQEILKVDPSNRKENDVTINGIQSNCADNFSAISVWPKVTARSALFAVFCHILRSYQPAYWRFLQTRTPKICHTCFIWVRCTFSQYTLPHHLLASAWLLTLGARDRK